MSLSDLPHDILLDILESMSLKDLYKISLCNQFMLKLVFNQTLKDFTKFKFPKNLKEKPILAQHEFSYTRDEKDNTFQSTQIRIWKPFVLSYFPNVDPDLNVKNWLHILRRRILHLKINEPRKLPIHKYFTDSRFLLIGKENTQDEKFIEGKRNLFTFFNYYNGNYTMKVVNGFINAH